MKNKKDNSILRVGIKFHDNDFYLTFTTALALIGTGIKYNFDKFKTKVLVNEDYIKRYFVIMLNNITNVCYNTTQTGFLSGTNNFINNKVIDTKFQNNDYLKVYIHDIFINKEIDVLFKSGYFKNGEFYILEIDLETGKIVDIKTE